MMKNNSSLKDPQDLRKRAEENLKSEPDGPDEMCLEEANSIIHELRVHQIELEMQNEDLRCVQNEIEVSRLQYLDLYDFAPVGYLTLNKQGQILELNLTAAKQLGIEKRDLIKTNFQNFIFQPDKGVFLSHLKAVFDKCEREITEVRLSPKGGEQFYARLESTYMEGGNGTGLCMTNTSDVTLNKRTEEALRESEQMSSLVLDTIPARVFWKDLDLNYLGCNLTFALDAGLQSPKEIVGRNDFEMPWGEQAQLYRSDDRLVIETGRSKLCYEEPQTAPSGDKIWLRTSKVPLINVKGEIRGVLGTYEDITGYKRANEELIKAQRVIQALSDCNDAVIHIEEEFELLRAICRIVVDVGGYRMAWVGYVEEDRDQTVTPVAKYGYEHDYLEEVKITWKDAERGSCPTGTCIRKGFPSIIRSVEKQVEFSPWKVEALERGYASVVGLPIFLDGRKLGALTIYSSETDSFDEEEVEFLAKLSSNLSYGIGALRLRKARMQAEESLKKANLDLERRVVDRTAELTKANAELRREVKERRKAERVLQESEQKYRILIETTGTGYVILDKEGKVIDANAEYLRIAGYESLQQIVGRNIAEWVAEHDRVRNTREVMLCIESGWVRNLEIDYVDEDGCFTPVEMNASAIRTAVDVKVLALCRDISERKEAEMSLKESEKRFRLMAETVGEVFWLTSPHSQSLLYISPAFERVWGRSCDDLYANPMLWLDAIYSEDVQEVLRVLEDLAQGQHYDVEFRITRPDGALRWINDRGYAFRDATGKVTLTSGVASDITKRKAAEQGMRDSEERLKLALAAARMGVWEWNVTTNTVIWSSECYDIFGVNSFDGKIESFTDLVHPKDRDRVWLEIKQAREKGTVYQVEFRIIRPDGNVRWLADLGQFEYDADGQPLRLVGNTQDITARKKVDRERELLMMAIEQTGDIVIMTGYEGNIQYVNPAFVATTGYTPLEAIGKNLRLLSSGRQDEAFYRNMWETISSGQTWKGRMINKRKDGTPYTEESTISPVLDHAGQIISYVAVKRDITEQLRLSDHLAHAQKMESVGQLAGGVAHDFNNMLGIILGYADIALDDVGPGTPVHEHLVGIRKAARRSADMTRQLLAFASKQTINPKVIDLNETVESMLKMLQRLIGENIDITWLPEVDLHPVKMDPVQIDQILANLFVNARDAIEGVGTVTIKTENVVCDAAYGKDHQDFTPGEYVMLSVSDNGCGMDKLTQSRIFEPFFTTKVFGKGTGLGLATVYGVVKQNSGFIKVYSELGRGATFKIYIPSHAAGIVATMAPRAAGLPQDRSVTVLMVEDETELLNVCKRMLEKLGYNVLCADTPGKAICLIEEHVGKIHLLLTDVVMPEMNGWDLAERLLAENPGIKCLFMSGYTASAIVCNSVLKKNVQFIQKPFSMQDLAAKVREVLDG